LLDSRKARKDDSPDARKVSKGTYNLIIKVIHLRNEGSYMREIPPHGTANMRGNIHMVGSARQHVWPLEDK